MKVSKYNFEVKMNELNKVLMYNAFTSSLALTEMDKYNKYIAFGEQNRKIEDLEFIDDLKKGGFLIDDMIDETKEIEIRMMRGRFYSSSLGLTIAPTSNCNFRCVYCYEKDVIKNRAMTQEVQDKIIDLVKEQVPRLTDLSITWYGGEPLLALDIIEQLSKEFMSICEENHINYSAGIITNGYLLTKEKVELLNKLKVNFYQITIDGSRENHNKSRPLVNGGETYDKILNNIFECYDVLPTVSIRVNVDKDNVSAGDDIANLLKEKKIIDKVKPYLGKITNDKHDCNMCNNCFNSMEFGRADLDYTRRNVEAVDWGNKYPDTKSNFCGADSMTSFVVDSDGKLYKCWSQIGDKDKAIGDLMTGDLLNRNVYYDLILYNPLEDKCKDCKLIPICLGGCPYDRQNNKDEDRCSVYKHSMDDYLQFFARQIIKDRERQGECAACEESFEAMKG